MNRGAQYLLVVHAAARRGETPVPPGEVAAAVGRSPSATTEMLQRLDRRGLLAYEAYTGATLTPAGQAAAEDLAGTYATLSRFFRDVLELDDHDEQALRLAGAVSPVVADRLEAVVPPEGEEGAEPTPPLPSGENER